MKRLFALALTLVLMFGNVSLFAGESSLVVVVKDSSGPVADALVSISSGKRTFAKTTDSDGKATFSNTKPHAPYTVDVSKDGYNTAVLTNVIAGLGQVELTVELVPTEVVERVVVPSKRRASSPAPKPVPHAALSAIGYVSTYSSTIAMEPQPLDREAYDEIEGNRFRTVEASPLSAGDTSRDGS